MDDKDIWDLIKTYDPSRREEAIRSYKRFHEFGATTAAYLAGSLGRPKEREILAERAVRALCAAEALAYLFYWFHDEPIPEEKDEGESIRAKFRPNWTAPDNMHFGSGVVGDPGREIMPPNAGAMEIIYMILRHQYPELSGWIDKHSVAAA